MPIQPAGAKGVRGRIVLHEQYKKGLRAIEGFSRLILIYAFHRSEGVSHEVIPFPDTVPHGIFATRAPKRPNAIGISIMQRGAEKDNVLEIENFYIPDRTPFLDIKPYVPAFDCF